MRALGKQLRDPSKRTLLHWSSSFLGRYFFPYFFSLDFAPCCLHCGWDLWSTVKKCMFRFQNKHGHYKWSHQPLANSSLWTPHEQQSKSHDTHKLQKRLKHKGKQAWLSTLVKDILMWLYFCYPFFSHKNPKFRIAFNAFLIEAWIDSEKIHKLQSRHEGTGRPL